MVVGVVVHTGSCGWYAGSCGWYADVFFLHDDSLDLDFHLYLNLILIGNGGELMNLKGADGEAILVNDSLFLLMLSVALVIVLLMLVGLFG